MARSAIRCVHSSGSALLRLLSFVPLAMHTMPPDTGVTTTDTANTAVTASAAVAAATAATATAATATVAAAAATAADTPDSPPKRQKLQGREFYESIGSPRTIVAPMVEQSELVAPNPGFHGPALVLAAV